MFAPRVYSFVVKSVFNHDTSLLLLAREDITLRDKFSVMSQLPASPGKVTIWNGIVILICFCFMFVLLLWWPSHIIFSYIQTCRSRHLISKYLHVVLLVKLFIFFLYDDFFAAQVFYLHVESGANVQHVSTLTDIWRIYPQLWDGLELVYLSLRGTFVLLLVWSTRQLSITS